MGVITITRQYGAGGSEVARLVAERLGWQLIDNEFVDQVAQRAGIEPGEVAAREERSPSLIERLVRALATASPEVFVPGASPATDEQEDDLVTTTEHVIAQAGMVGNVVLVGRGAQAYLARSHANALHAFVVAPLENRIEALVKRLSVGPDEAKQQAEKMEADRDRYVQRFYQRDRRDPANYHIVVNTGLLGYAGAADVIASLVKGR